MAGFETALATFQQATDAGRAADPQSVEDLQAAMGPIGQSCGGCHEKYRQDN
jgi:cytochrome c556